MKKKISKLQILRIVTQIIFFVFFPGLITLTFSELKQIYLMIIKGNFNFVEAFPHLIEALVIIPITIIFGRFFCGWFCIFGTFNDYIYAISRKIFKIKFRVNAQLDAVLKYIKYVIILFIIIVIWTMGSSLFDTVSPWDAFAQISDFPQAITQYPVGFMVLALIILGAVFIERFFCRYLCPLGAVFSIVSKIRIFKINKPTNGCGKCRICSNNCPMGIELYKFDKVGSGECINCLKCIPVCPRKNTQASICDENLNPALASAVAITAFAGLYTADNMIGKIINENNATISTNGNLSYSTNNNSQQNKYKDGTYIGVGNGFRPNLNVSVTIKNNKITDIEIMSNDETPRYAQEPFQVIPNEIIQAQSTNVDGVSGATRSSNGIKEAVENALSQALIGNTTADNSNSATENNNNLSVEGNKTVIEDNKNSLAENSDGSNSDVNSNSSDLQSKKLKDGTYTGVGNGFRPNLKVSVTIKNSKITDIQIISSDETPRYAQEPFQVIPNEIIQAQSTNVDGVSGATRSSNGIKEAVEDALSLASSIE